MRVAFTIVLNGEHHLRNNFKNNLDIFDKWIIVEGVAAPGGSTNWCKSLPGTESDDNTMEFCKALQLSHPDKVVYLPPPYDYQYSSKDEQVNEAIKRVKRLTGECFLWQVDVDEVWKKEDVENAERVLRENGAKTMGFYCNYYVGKNQIVKGEWGEGKHTPYIRLWDWKGEMFKTHEPPRLDPNNGKTIISSIRFDHFAYVYEQDVKFKEIYYQGYEGLFDRWTKVQLNKGKLHISALLGTNTWWGTTDTYIHCIK